MIQKLSIIFTEQLTLNDLPTINADWIEISKFALRFDPNENERFNSVTFDKRSRIYALRMKLYVEQRRWNHYNQRPHRSAMEEIQNIVREIRDLLL